MSVIETLTEKVRRMARIYLASSWRNESQPELVRRLRQEGHKVYDFRNPVHGLVGGFKWAELDPAWQSWSPEAFRLCLLNSPACAQGFMSDLRGIEWCDICVLVMPCGHSAHLELGYAAGRGKRTVILLSDGKPELMYLFADLLVTDSTELLRAI